MYRSSPIAQLTHSGTVMVKSDAVGDSTRRPRQNVPSGSLSFPKFGLHKGRLAPFRAQLRNRCGWFTKSDRRIGDRLGRDRGRLWRILARLVSIAPVEAIVHGLAAQKSHVLQDVEPWPRLRTRVQSIRPTPDRHDEATAQYELS